MNPLYFPNQIALENSDRIIAYINNHLEDFGDIGKPNNRDTYWDGRNIHYDQIQDKEIQNILKQQLNFTIDKLYAEIKQKETLYPDILSICRWPEGFELLPHADAAEPDGREHPFPWRTYGSVTFLNEDFEGGTLYYPKLNTEFSPKIGHTVIHKGDLEHLHGVTKITKGTRYTVASFFTYDSSKRVNL
jgi:predicted 2-oxoglutarate/Fe(II)-dependent dioxygenase YbiX